MANSESIVRPRLSSSGTQFTSTTSITQARLSNTGYSGYRGLHLAFLVVNVNETINVSGTGWGKAFQVNNGTTTLCVAVAQANTASVDCTFSWTSSATGRVVSGYIDSPIDPFSPTALDNVGSNSSDNTGSGTGVSLASVNSSGTLGSWLYSIAAINTVTNNPPSGWAEYFDNGSVQGSVAAGWKSYFEEAVASGSLSLVNVTAVAWVARLWEVKVADALSGLTTNEMEIAVLGGLGPGLATTELEIATLLSLAPPPPVSGRRRLIIVN